MEASTILKKLHMLILCLFQILILTSCTLTDMVQQMRRNTSEVFYYKYSDSWGKYGEFGIWLENGVAYFEGFATSEDINVDVFAEVEMEIFDDIAQVIIDNRIDLWDGFSKRNSEVLDGYGFSLNFNHGTNSVKANGYMYQPENYQAGHDALLGFLCEYAEDLSVTIPSPDSVNYIILSTEEFRFDLLLRMYDGIYSQVNFISVRKKSTAIFAEWDFYKFGHVDNMPPDEIGMYVDPIGSYVEFDFEFAQQIRERALETVSSNGLPRDSLEYVAIQYPSRKANRSHFAHAILSKEDQNWFIEKMFSILGLSSDFNLDTLFNIQGQ